MDRKKIYGFCKKHINANNIKMIILFIPLVLVIINEIINGKFIIKDFYDSSILISFIVVFLCESIADVLLSFIEKKTEDDVKLNTDYLSLVGKYCLEKEKMVCYKYDGKTIYIPAVVLFECKIKNAEQYKIVTEKDISKIKYQLPKQIADNSSELFNAHSHSIVYNNINVRLNDLVVTNGEIILKYGFTTYFDSLLTNRAMDYPFKKNRTVREIYEPGPYLNSLTDSKLSNHLGFNGFVELKDGNIVFLKRRNQVSIAKGMWQQSVGASLKSKYCINGDHELTREGLLNAINEEIKDELKIDTLHSVIFAFYRDLVEGGKPQFLFYSKSEQYDKESFLSHFNSGYRKDIKIDKKLITDGSQLVFYKIEELRKCRFETDRMIDETGKEYKMMPSTIASIIMLINNY